MLINKRIFPEKISMIELFLLWFWDANTIVGLLKPRRWSLCIYENRLLFSISFILNLKEARKTVNLSRGGPSGEAIAACLPPGVLPPPGILPPPGVLSLNFYCTVYNLLF